MGTLVGGSRLLSFLDLIGPNYKVTREGGIAFKLTNKTGERSVKGQAINVSPDYDDSYIAATDPFTIQGFVYEAGIPDGGSVWVVRDGLADALLEDGYTAARDGWVRLSPTTPGRVITQNRPGLDYYADSVTYDGSNGATVSGTVASTRQDDGTKLVISGTTVGPSIDARFVYTGITELPNEIDARGYFGANRAAGCVINVWDFVAGGGSWVLAGTWPANGTTDVTVTFAGLTADMLSGGEMRIQLLANDAGTTADRLYVDKLVIRSTSNTEHFKELGHVMRAADAGTDVLARINIHFL